MPNPFKETLQVGITSENNTVAELELTDVTGRSVLVQKYKLIKGVNQVSIYAPENLAAGTYLLQVINTADNSISTFKLTKE